MTTELILNGEYKLDPHPDLDLLITYQVGDVRAILSRNSSYSKTVSIVGTANNNKAFSNLFDVKNYSEFDPNKKASVLVIDGGVKIFEGFLKIDSIKIVSESLISYECTMYSQVADLFTNLGGLKLNQLDFSEYNHTYNRDNVVGSWDNFIIEHGQKRPVSLGNGYVYPYVDFGNGTSKTAIKQVEFFKPAFYAKTVWDKIFKTAKCSYRSEFINSDYFKKLIIIPSADSFQIADSTVNDSKIWVSQESEEGEVSAIQLEYGSYVNNIPDTPFIYQFTKSMALNPNTVNGTFGVGILKFPNETDNGRYDNGGNWDTTLHEYTVPVTGQYKITANFNLDLKFSNNTYANGSPMPAVQVRTYAKYVATINCLHNGIYRGLDNKIIERITDVNVTQNETLLGRAANDEANFDFNSDTPYLLEAGDKISIRVSAKWKVLRIIEDCLPFYYDVRPRYEFCQTTPTDMKIELANNTIVEGTTWDFSSYLSQDQCKDYILSLAKMFNLYFEFDKDQENTLIIEPRKDFYNGSVIDWTYKMDRNNENEIFPMSEISSRNLHFSYKSDGDYYNDDYQKNHLSPSTYNLGDPLTYGEFTHYIDNDFVDKTSEDKIDLIFASTPLVQDTYFMAFTGGTLTASTRVISPLFNIENTYDKKPASSTAPRILFYGGMIDCDSWGIYDKSNLLYNGAMGVLPHSTYTKYPYAGHLNNPYNPTEDLNFGYPLEYYYDRTNTTNSNLFFKYWSQAVAEIQDKGSKLMSAYFHLTIADIQALSFRDIIYLDSSYWIINQIIDFNPLDDSLTKVELLKLVNYNKSGYNITSYQQSVNLNHTPKLAPVKGKDSVLIGPFNPRATDALSSNIVRGQWNIVPKSAENTLVLGHGNMIPSNQQGSLVLGSHNMLGGGSSNVMVLGNRQSVDEILVNAIVVGNDISGATSNSINTPKINFVSNGEEDNGTISFNGVPVMTLSPSGLTFQSSASTVSASRILSGSTDLLDIFVTQESLSGLTSSLSAYTASISFNSYTASTSTALGSISSKASLSGATFTGPLIAPSVSATTYHNLPTDVYVSGGTFTVGTATFTNSTGGTFSLTGMTTPFTGGTVSGATSFLRDITANTITVGKGGGNVATNTAIGYQALANNSGGTANVAIGYQALQLNSGGTSNVSIGQWALQNNISGNQNIAIGYLALQSNTSATQNTAIGFAALAKNTTGIQNAAFGPGSLSNNVTGNYNMAFGVSTLASNTTGGSNLAMGYYTLNNVTTYVSTINLTNGGAGYTAATVTIGASPLGGTATATASVNPSGAITAITITNNGSCYVTTPTVTITGNGTGATATAVIATASNNIGIGDNVLRANSKGSNNLAIGGISMTSLSSGNNNTAIGHSTAIGLTTGNNNTLLGTQAGYNLTTGSYNTLIGTSTGLGLMNGSYNTIIGNVIGLASGLTNTVIIADGQGNKRIYADSTGKVGINTASPSYMLDVNGDVSLKTAGNKLYIASGTNASVGVTVLTGGTAVVNTTSVTANSLIFITPQEGGILTGVPRVSARVAGTSFTILSTSSGDTATVAWQIIN